MSASMYAPDYLKNQKDPQLHLIAEMIEKNTENMSELQSKLTKATELIDKLADLLNGHHEGCNYLAFGICNKCGKIMNNTAREEISKWRSGE